MEMEAGLDTGPVLLRRRLEIGPEKTTGDLHDQLAEMGAEAIAAALDDLEHLVPEPQPKTGVTYAEKIDKASRDRLDPPRPGGRPSGSAGCRPSRALGHGCRGGA